MDLNDQKAIKDKMDETGNLVLKIQKSHEESVAKWGAETADFKRKQEEMSKDIGVKMATVEEIKTKNEEFEKAQEEMQKTLDEVGTGVKEMETTVKAIEMIIKTNVQHSATGDSGKKELAAWMKGAKQNAVLEFKDDDYVKFIDPGNGVSGTKTNDVVVTDIQESGGALVQLYELHTEILKKIPDMADLRQDAMPIKLRKANTARVILDEDDFGGAVSITELQKAGYQTDKDQKFVIIHIPVHESEVTIRVSNQDIDFSTVDMLEYSEEKLPLKWKNKGNRGHLFGTGVNEPLGMLSGNVKYTQVKSGRAGQCPASPDIFLDMISAVKFANPANLKWYTSLKGMIETLKYKDNDNRYQDVTKFLGIDSFILWGFKVKLYPEIKYESGQIGYMFGDVRISYGICDTPHYRITVDKITEPTYTKHIHMKYDGGGPLIKEALVQMPLKA